MKPRNETQKMLDYLKISRCYLLPPVFAVNFGTDWRQDLAIMSRQGFCDNICQPCWTIIVAGAACGEFCPSVEESPGKKAEEQESKDLI